MTPLPCAECKELVPLEDEEFLGDLVFHKECASKYVNEFFDALEDKELDLSPFDE